MTTDFLRPLTSVPENPEWYAKEIRKLAGDLDGICDALNVRVVYPDFDTDKTGTSALLAPEQGGFVAIVASCVVEEDPDQARFYIGHEIGHTLFYDCREDKPFRTLPFTPEEEGFCDAFGKALLRRL